MGNIMSGSTTISPLNPTPLVADAKAPLPACVLGVGEPARMRRFPAVGEERGGVQCLRKLWVSTRT